ncbi:TetR/AcrR family transcriptional regulator [Nocardia arthritidis]|uniref:TetR/AcrR family transcriptional regulator n=1 Tax=Nocardia arthritidis TaxID=228602 RepID=UPI00142E6E3C|nr:TetR/AcrR family transcriptional regulator [Nocardia arthritidis]
MPRVSEEHLERRRQQILDAAQLCFTRKGFHETSMQDVFAESGLSAGAVYRYFKSKNELIAAIAAATADEVRDRLDTAINADPLPTPDELVRTMTEMIIENSGPSGRIRLAPQAWALALVQPEANAFVGAAMTAIRGHWELYAERMRDQGWIAPDADTAAIAVTAVGMFPGFMLQHLILGDVDPDTIARGLRALLTYNHKT